MFFRIMVAKYEEVVMAQALVKQRLSEDEYLRGELVSEVRHYTTIPTLQEYLLLSQDRVRAEIFRRAEGWQPQVITAGELALQCPQTQIPLAAIYEDVLL